MSREQVMEKATEVFGAERVPEVLDILYGCGDAPRGSGVEWEQARNRVRLGILRLCGEPFRLRGGKTEDAMTRPHRLVKMAQADYRDILAAFEQKEERRMINAVKADRWGRAGFTLMELLVAIGILALLAAILLPVFGKVREQGRRAACFSNLHQIGLALSAYTQDYDEKHPASSVPVGNTGIVVTTSSGWAGTLFPHVRNTAVFKCPDDSNVNQTGGVPAYPVSYALNSNLTDYSEAALSAPSSTVLAFEVTQDSVRITEPSEGQGKRAPQTSAAGNGIDGGLLNLTGEGDTQSDGALYATGLLDNHEAEAALPIDQYQQPLGRHTDGSNFLADDGHVKWLRPEKVSAGSNALRPNNPQAHTGCSANGSPKVGLFPCAAGTASGSHTMTFSLN